MLNTTKYYDEFLRYHEMSEWQHHNCNLGTTPYNETPYDDDLIKQVRLYDVVERKYAGFTQLLLDIRYSEKNHPYAHKMSAIRSAVVTRFDTSFWSLQEWLYVFFVHRLTGSGINYASRMSGYHNSVLLYFNECHSIEDMVEVIKNHKGPKFTSSGYQIAPFPKPQGDYVRGGDWFMCEVLPDLVRQFASHISNKKLDFRSMMSWLEKYNQDRGFRVFRFQYAATLADIADFFPDLVETSSPFFYGKNAMECLNFLADRPKGKSQIDFLDSVMEKISKDTGMLAYNAEDVACDAIRWIENYINPKLDYSHLDLDKVWSSHGIEDHPFGRQRPMLNLGLVDTFNGKGHPSDTKILDQSGVTVEEYKSMVKSGKFL